MRLLSLRIQSHDTDTGELDPESNAAKSSLERITRVVVPRLEAIPQPNTQLARGKFDVAARVRDAFGKPLVAVRHADQCAPVAPKPICVYNPRWP